MLCNNVLCEECYVKGTRVAGAGAAGAAVGKGGG